MCRICVFLRWLSSPDYFAREERFFDINADFESGNSNDADIFHSDTVANRQRMTQAHALIGTDTAAARAIFLDLAENGSVWSMYMTGWFFARSLDGWRDEQKGLDWYHRAICGGSWSATVGFADLLREQKRYAEAENVLKDGVAADFVPAMYRLARLRYEQKPRRSTAEEVRGLLESAVAAGHPAAEAYLARMMLLGNYGLGRIPEGWRRASVTQEKFLRELDGGEEAHLAAPT